MDERLGESYISQASNEELERMTQSQIEEEFDADYAVNVYGLMWTAQAAGKIFKAQGSGNLIITASVSSVLVNVPQPQTSYNSSKAAAAHMGKNLAVEWIDFARVNCVSPGYVATNSESMTVD